MADIVNRSPFRVAVQTRSKLDEHAPAAQQFPYKRKQQAVDYAAALVAMGHEPSITQLETSFQVRIRQKGQAVQTVSFASFAEADQFVSKLDSDAKVGLFRDYTEGAQTTTAQLIERYIAEECPGMKGGANYIIILRAMLEDSQNVLRQRIEQRKREMRELGKVVTPLGANRQPMSCLEWLHLPLTKVRPAHIHDFIRDRLEDVAPSTVDRQLDLLSRVYTVAQQQWRIHLDTSPMMGVNRGTVRPTNRSSFSATSGLGCSITTLPPPSSDQGWVRAKTSSNGSIKPLTRRGETEARRPIRAAPLTVATDTADARRTSRLLSGIVAARQGEPKCKTDKRTGRPRFDPSCSVAPWLLPVKARYLRTFNSRA